MIGPVSNKKRAPGLARRLTAARIHLGMTQIQLAEAAGTSQAVIQKIENGGTTRPRMLPEMAKALRVPVEWLAYGVVGERADLDAAIAHGYKRRR